MVRMVASQVEGSGGWFFFPVRSVCVLPTDFTVNALSGFLPQFECVLGKSAILN